MEIFANKQQAVCEVKPNLDKWPGGSFPIDGWAEGHVTRVAGARKSITRYDKTHRRVRCVVTPIDLFRHRADRKRPGKEGTTTLIARRAYNAIMRLRQDVDLSNVQKNKLDVNVARLKSELEGLGQTF